MPVEAIQEVDFERQWLICRGCLFMFDGLRWEVIVRFVDVGEIVNHHCLEVIVRFADVGELVDHHCLEVII